MEPLYLPCPHCGEYVEIPLEWLNCRIFRHGNYKDTYLPIDPHTPKEKCLELVEKGLIYGCGKPFRYNGQSLEICDYL